jgi:hypothetical protein
MCGSCSLLLVFAREFSKCALRRVWIGKLRLSGFFGLFEKSQFIFRAGVGLRLSGFLALGPPDASM